jgi:hypothetical protein
MPAITPRLRVPLAAALRGERTVFAELTDDELAALEEHGVAPLAFASSSAPQLRGVAMRASVIEPLRLTELRRVLDGLRVQPLILKGIARGARLRPGDRQRRRAGAAPGVVLSRRSVRHHTRA